MELQDLQKPQAAKDEVNWITATFMAAFHVGAVAALFFFSAIFFMLALHESQSSGTSATEFSRTPGPQIIVPSMTLAYFVMLGAMYGLVKRQRRRPFWQAVGWHWPSGWWLGYIVFGSILAVGLGETRNA